MRCYGLCSSDSYIGTYNMCNVYMRRPKALLHNNNFKKKVAPTGQSHAYRQYKNIATIHYDTYTKENDLMHHNTLKCDSIQQKQQQRRENNTSSWCWCFCRTLWRTVAFMRTFVRTLQYQSACAHSHTLYYALYLYYIRIGYV